MASSSLILHREAPEAIGAPGLSGSHPAEALLRCGLTVQGVNVAVNPLDDQGLYACGVEDIERQIDAALTASRTALASVRAMPGSQDRADAAVREVKEETGLRIEAGGVIGRRVHPATGRTMVYMAAQPTHGTDVFVGDEEELAEVRWASLSEAEELMNGMIFEPVQKYLKQALGNGKTGHEG